MSFPEIIEEIKLVPEIWCSSHPDYKSKTIKKAKWRMLATKLNIPEITLMKRWKHLKDQYRKEVKKRPAHMSEEEADNWQSSWSHYRLMKFINEEVKLSPSTVCRMEHCQVIDSQETDSNDSTNFRDIPEIVNHTYKVKKINNIKEHMLEIENKILLMEKRLSGCEDEDYLFLMSILPYFRKFTEVKKLRFRNKINQWLLETMTESKKD